MCSRSLSPFISSRLSRTDWGVILGLSLAPLVLIQLGMMVAAALPAPPRQPGSESMRPSSATRASTPCPRSELEDSRRDGAGVAAHDFAAAMGENGVSHALLAAPGELCANRRVPDQVLAAPAHHGPGHRGAVACIMFFTFIGNLLSVY